MTDWNTTASYIDDIWSGSTSTIELRRLSKTVAELCRAMGARIERPPEVNLRPTVYCYEPQRRAVESFLAPYTQVVPVSDAKFMRGISRGTFVYITSHPDHVPTYVWPHLQQDGWIVLTIDDSYARAKAAR